MKPFRVTDTKNMFQNKFLKVENAQTCLETCFCASHSVPLPKHVSEHHGTCFSGAVPLPKHCVETVLFQTCFRKHVSVVEERLTGTRILQLNRAFTAHFDFLTLNSIYKRLYLQSACTVQNRVRFVVCTFAVSPGTV